MCSLLPLGRAAWAQSPPPCATTAPTCNLMWNGSFEETKNGNCPNLTGGFGNRQTLNPNEPATNPGDPPPTAFNDLVCKWRDGNESTADLYNVCSISAEMSIPCNSMTGCGSVGYPSTGQPTRTGNGYAGLYATADITYNQSNPLQDYREYIGQNVTLTAGKRYYVEFYSAIAALSDWSVAKLGVAFAPTTTKYATSGPIALTPVVEQPVGTTPGTWTLVNGFFQATGQEQRLLIGNFGPTYSTVPGAPLPYNNGPAPTKGGILDAAAYYFIEDALLLPVPTAGTNTTTCGGTVQLGDCPLPASAGVTYTWSPTTGLSNPNIANPVLTLTTPGLHTYTLTVSLPGQAPQVTSVQVRVAGPVSIAASASPSCKGSTVTLTASGGDGQNYTWSPATGLSSTTGATVVATLNAAISYTVTSGCNTQGSRDLTVLENCCELQMAKTPPVYLKGGVSNTFFTSPFDPSTPAIYYADDDLYLEQDTYYLPPGAKLLLAANKNVYVANNAQFTLEGATITSACGEMWGGVYVQHDARGMLTRALNGARASVEHSLKGFVLEEPISSFVPTFAFLSTDFRQNYQSIDISRVSQRGLPDDEMYDCTFDSHPAAFQPPYQNNNPSDPIYSRHHVRLRGDVRAHAWENNRFSHAIFGIFLAPDYGWLHLDDNQFENCYYAGLVSDDIQGPEDLLGYAAKVILTHNRFQLPDKPLVSSQLSTEVGLIAGDPKTCFGAELPFQTTLALDNTFWCADALQLYGGKYEFVALRGEKQIGLRTRKLTKAEGNTFQTLAIGLDVHIGTGESAEIRGNEFIDCERGERLVARPSMGGAAVAFNSCNTYTPYPTRGGTAYGIVVDAVGTNPPALAFDDPSNIGGGTALKDLFTAQSFNGTGFVAIANNTSSTINYNSITGYGNTYQGWSYGVAFNDVGAINENDPALYPCRKDGYQFTGIQQRPAASPPTPAIIKPAIQSAPNPCSGSTEFHYQVPATARQVAVRLQRGTDGRELTTLALSPRATTYQLNVQHYPAGVYFYTLLVDGVPHGTHRLLVQ